MAVSGTENWQLRNARMSLEVQSLGAMIGPWRVDLGGREVSPLAVAPWADEAQAASVPPILQRLRGEWPCVPFGITRPAADFPAHLPLRDTAADALVDNAIAHGFGANHHWLCEARGEDWIELSIDYPSGYPVRRLQRRIALAADADRVDLELGVQTRAACSLPLGLHAVLALADAPGSCSLHPGAWGYGRTYPVRFEDCSQLAVDHEFVDLANVLTRDGAIADLTCLPLAQACEELVQLHGMTGHFTLRNHAQGYAATLAWEPAQFPSCVLWISNRGRTAYPWAGRHLALGVEPTCSFFDLNPSIAPQALHRFAANECWRTRYSVSVRAIGGGR